MGSSIAVGFVIIVAIFMVREIRRELKKINQQNYWEEYAYKAKARRLENLKGYYPALKRAKEKGKTLHTCSKR